MCKWMTIPPTYKPLAADPLLVQNQYHPPQDRTALLQLQIQSISKYSFHFPMNSISNVRHRSTQDNITWKLSMTRVCVGVYVNTSPNVFFAYLCVHVCVCVIVYVFMDVNVRDFVRAWVCICVCDILNE